MFGSSAGVDVNRMRALNDEVATWKSRAENLMAEVKVAQRKAASAEAEVERVEGRAARAAEAQAKAETQLKSVQAEIAQMRDNATQSSRDLNTQLKKSEAETNRLAADADKVSNHANALQRRVDALLTEKASLESTAAEALASASKARDAARLAKANEEEMGKVLEEKSVELVQVYAELERVKAGKAASDAQFEALTSKLTHAHEETAAQQAAFNDIVVHADTSELASKELERQVKSQRERADAAELAVEALKAQLALAHAEAGAKAEAQRVATDALDQVNAQMEALRLEKNNVAASRDAGQDATARLDLNIRELQAQLGQRDATIMEMTEVLDTLRADLQAKSEALGEAQVAVENTTGALGTVKNKSAADASEMQDFMTMLNQELEVAVKKREDAELAAKQATEALDNARRAAIKSAQDAEEAGKEVEEMKSELMAEADRAEALSQLLADREAELSSLRNQVAKAEAVALQAEGLAEQADVDQRRLNEAGERHAAVEEELSTLKEELQGKQRALEAAVGAAKDAERKVDAIKVELKTAEERISELQATVEETEDRISAYESDKAAGAMAVGDARSAQRDLEIAAADANKAASGAAAELQTTREELEAAQQRLEAAERSVMELTHELNDGRAAIASATAWKARVAELEGQLRGSEQALEEATSNAAAQKERLETMNAVREAEVAALKSANNSPVKLPAAAAAVRSSGGGGDEEKEDHAAVAKSLVANVFGNVVGKKDEDGDRLL